MKDDPRAEFALQRQRNIDAARQNRPLRELSFAWLRASHDAKYDYNFSWLGRPVIQMPQDLVGMQELIWRIKPGLIVETGIAHGGSLIFYASMLELIGGRGTVLGIDLDIRAHNRTEIERHPLCKRVEMMEGSSVDESVVRRVYERAKDDERVLVVLDSNHTHEHVLRELRLYSGLVKPGSYVIVFDTLIEDMPADAFGDRPWGVGDNPKTAVYEFLQSNDRFEIDEHMNAKLLLSSAPDGYLKCIK